MLEDKARLTKLQDLRNAQVEKYGLTKKQLSQMLSPYDNYKEIGSQPKLKNLRKKEPPKERGDEEVEEKFLSQVRYQV